MKYLESIESLRFKCCDQRQRERNKNTIGSFCGSSSHQNDFQSISPIGVGVAHWPCKSQTL